MINAKEAAFQSARKGFNDEHFLSDKFIESQLERADKNIKEVILSGRRATLLPTPAGIKFGSDLELKFLERMKLELEKHGYNIELRDSINPASGDSFRLFRISW